MPATTEVNVFSLKELREANDVAVIIYVEADDKASRKHFAAIAEEMRDDYVFLVASDGDVVAAEKVATPSIVVDKKVAETRTILEGPQSEESMRAFIKTATQPLVVEMHPELHRDYLSVG
jgi:protein disulfide-isomerase A1